MNSISPAERKRLRAAFAAGASVRTAAIAAGVDRGTAQRYRRIWRICPHGGQMPSRACRECVSTQMRDYHAARAGIEVLARDPVAARAVLRYHAAECLTYAADCLRGGNEADAEEAMESARYVLHEGGDVEFVEDVLYTDVAVRGLALAAKNGKTTQETER